MTARTSDNIADAFRKACRAELRALKPGNVHIHAGGHGMTVAQFEASADAAAIPIAAAGLTVGTRILEAVRATHRAAGCNTNLGIILLVAPLAQAALSDRGEELRGRLRQVLETLDRGDAESAFEAIRLAAPGGLGRSDRHDVARPPAVSLRDAMAEAAGRDSIALQYVTAFEDIFTSGQLWLREGLDRWHDLEWAAVSAYLGFMALHPDTHVLRKHGADMADEIQRLGGEWHARLQAAARPGDLAEPLLALDADLKERDINPGTSADLTVASLFTLFIEKRD